MERWTKDALGLWVILLSMLRAQMIAFLETEEQQKKKAHTHTHTHTPSDILQSMHNEV